MADAELRLRAVLEDDASRGIDQLDNRVRASGQAAADANRLSGRSAQDAARETGTAASKIAASYKSAADAATRFARSAATSVSSKLRGDITGAVGALNRLRDGYRSSAAAASSFSGKAGTIGGALRGIVSQAKSAVSGLRSVAGTAAEQGRAIGSNIVSGVKDRMSSLADTVKGGLRNAAALAGAAVGAAFVLQVGQAIQNAGALEQSMGAMNAVFKDNAGQMIQWSNEAARTTGLSKLEYQELATVLGASLKNGGMAMDEVGGKTNELIGVGADLASMFGGTTAGAVEAVTAALRGEMDPIEKFGVGLNAAAVEAEAAALGFEKVAGELSREGKQAAILSLIMKQTQDAHGNFARETETFSGSIQILKARWSDLTTQWASYVLPILGRLISTISGPVMSALEGMTNGLAAFFVFLNGGADADWGVLTGVEQAAANAGLALHNAFAGGASAARDFVGSIDWPAVGGWFLDIYHAVSPLGPAIQAFVLHAGDGMAQLGTTIGTALAVIAPALVPVIAGLAEVVAKILELTGPALPILIPLLGGALLAFKAFGVVASIIGGASTAVKLLVAAIRLIPLALAMVPFVGWAALAISALVLAYQKVDWFRAAVDAAMKWIVEAFRNAADWVVEAWRNAGNVLAQIWENTKAEVTAVTTFFSQAWAAAKLALDVVWTGIQNAASAVLNWFVSTAVAGWTAASQSVGATMTWLKDNIITPVWDGIRIAIAVAAGAVMTLWDLWMAAVRGPLSSAFTWFRDSVITPVWNTIRTIIQTAVQFVQNNIFNPLMAFIRGPLTSAWNFLQALISTVWTAVRAASTLAWNFLRDSVFQPIIDFIRGAFNAAWTWIRDQITQRWQNTRDVSAQAWAFLRDSVFQPIINFIRGAFTSAWNYIRDTISTIWNAIRTASSQAWAFLRGSVFQPIIDFIRGAFTSAWNFLRDTVRDRWTAARDTLSSGWNTIRTTIFDPLTNMVRNTIPDAFSSAVTAIRSRWDQIVGVIRAPVDTVVGIIKNTLIGNINAALRAVGMDDRQIVIGTNTGTGGGSGMAPGWRNGGYTGAGAPHAVAGVVHRDEQVIRSPARRSIEEEFPGLLDSMNRSGAAALGAAAPGVGVYAGYPSFSGGLQQAIFGSGVLNVSGAAPGYDMAGAIRMVDNATRVNVRAGSGNPQVNVVSGAFPDWWAGYYSGNTIRLNNNVAGAMSLPAKRVMLAHEIGHALGLPHSDPSGLQSMMSYANMYNHNSVTAADVSALSAIYGGTGFASGGGGIDILGMITKGLTALWDSVSGGGIVGDLAVGAGKWLFERLKTWAMDIITPGASRGMVLGGYTPRSDQTPIMASKGESVLTPELTNALGPANIQAANLATSGAKTPGQTRKALGLLGAAGPTSGGTQVVVQMDVTVQGNADRDALDDLREELEDALGRILEDTQRRGY